MKFINICGLLLLSVTVFATEYAPWFTTPLEFQGRLSYLYEHANSVQSPLGNFAESTRDSSALLGLAVTPWPYWNVEAELFLTHTSDIAFAYEAALLTVRYAWLDDITGDCFSLVTGATLSFPGTRFLHEFSFFYHGHANTEFHATMGKEWASEFERKACLWGLVGYGIAERGSPWLHGLGVFEMHPHHCIVLGIFAEALYGLGHNNITHSKPFSGYASIGHQSINLGSYLDYEIHYLGTLKLLGWYRPHAHNCVENAWGLSATFLFPFSII